MPVLKTFLLSLLAISWLGCSTVTPSPQESWADTEVECTNPREDTCTTVVCGGDTCGIYRCEDVPGGVQRVLFPPARPPAAAAAPGSGPQRNWGSGMRLPGEGGPIMVFPWHGEPRPAPPNRQLPAGRFEKHHIFPQAQDLAEWFKGRGINIHDYTLPIPRDTHVRIHRGGERGGEWNNAWRDFKGRNATPSREEIFKHAGELIYRFQLLGGPIQPYHSRPG
ncbi:TIGR02269 family lipoprotein [Pyxidicoccus caerfyrddinensis]|uniref:SitA6 family polymorphic toxin lipoprotein n=1 Tax=Pyxidicoccus caerfyrddinensis TaxID=2709663 RepID=UPI0013DC9473|nr:TIGR02269 family lipoprotein [Pyxidicoccus caerfyrddinensis]